MQECLPSSEASSGSRPLLEAEVVRVYEVHCKVYSGHTITGDQLQPSAKAVEAVLSAPRLQDVNTPQSYMGINKFSRKFIPRPSAISQPLNSLLAPGAPWARTLSARGSLLQNQGAAGISGNVCPFLPCIGSLHEFIAVRPCRSFYSAEGMRSGATYHVRVEFSRNGAKLQPA